MSITSARTWTATTIAASCLLAAGALVQGCADTSSFADGGDLDGNDAVPSFDGAAEVDAYLNPCAPGPPPAVTGRVLAPNGVDPVAGAAVFVPVSPLAALPAVPATVRCESCAVAGRFAAVTYTDPDGRFRLERVPNDTPFKLGLQKGYFRRVVQVSVPACGELALEPTRTTLPGSNGEHGAEDTVPRIAVVTGAWDELQKVLYKLGVAEVTLFNGRDLGTGPDSFQALLQDAARLRSFHLLFINCGNRFENLVTSPGPARDSIADYVRRGGRLFVSDKSYDFAEQVFPPYVDFQGSDDTPPHRPEAHNAAEVGSQTATIRADVRDDQLRAWLALPEIDALSADGRVELIGFQTGWAVARQANRDLGVKVWIDGPAVWAGGTGVRPLTLTYDFRDDDDRGCGRVLFSSYHTHGNAPVLLAQERVLEYLMLEMGTCIDLD